MVRGDQGNSQFAHRANPQAPIRRVTFTVTLCANEQKRSVVSDSLGLFETPHHWRSIMPLITLIVTLAVVGLILWAINTYLPMDGKIKKILNVVVVIIVILWLLQVFGLLPSLSAMRIG
jgi:hypothetical protein